MSVLLGEIAVHSQQVVTVIPVAPAIILVMELLDYTVAFSSLSVFMGPKCVIFHPAALRNHSLARLPFLCVLATYLQSTGFSEKNLYLILVESTVLFFFLTNQFFL